MHVFLIGVTVLANILTVTSANLRELFVTAPMEALIGVGLNNLLLLGGVLWFRADVRLRNRLQDYGA
jgi:hypothetical protein